MKIEVKMPSAERIHSSALKPGDVAVVIESSTGNTQPGEVVMASVICTHPDEVRHFSLTRPGRHYTCHGRGALVQKLAPGDQIILTVE